MRDGHSHAGQPGEHGQRHQLAVPQLAQVELPPRLEPDDEEEERHQAAVHPVPSVCETPSSPIWIDRFVSQTSRYEVASAFAQISAATTAPSRIVALPVSVRRKELSGVSRLRAHAVRPENRVASPASTAWAAAQGVSATAASGVATRKLKLSSR